MVMKGLARITLHYITLHDVTLHDVALHEQLDVVLTTMMMKTVLKNLMLNTKEEAAEAENSKCLHSPGG